MSEVLTISSKTKTRTKYTKIHLQLKIDDHGKINDYDKINIVNIIP